MPGPESCKVCEKECWGNACSIPCAKEFQDQVKRNMNQKYGANSIRGGESKD